MPKKSKQTEDKPVNLAVPLSADDHKKLARLARMLSTPASQLARQAIVKWVTSAELEIGNL